MRNGMKSWVRFILPALLAVWMLSGCGGDDQADRVLPPERMNTERTAVNLAITDAVTGAPVGAALAVAPKFSVTITGTDLLGGNVSKWIYDGAGNRMWNTTTASAIPFTNVDKFLTFYIRAPDGLYPLALNVVVKGAGYVTNSQSLFIKFSANPVLIPVEVKMTSSGAGARTALNGIGIDVKEAALTIPGGVTTVPVSVKTRSIETASGTGAVSVTIPGGTTLMTADGSPAVSPLNATVAYFNPITNDSLAAFPGGMLVREQPNGTAFAAGQTPATFITGGFTSVEILDANGNAVRDFDAPVMLTMTVPKGLGNPVTGAPLAAGDVIPLWSYDTATGEWTAHRNAANVVITGMVGDGDGDGAVDVPPATDADGDWIVSFPTTHLSYFNLDWFAWYQNVPGATAMQCQSTPLKVVGAQGQKIFFIAEAQAGGFSHEAWLDANSNAPLSETVQILNAPTIPMRYTAYLNYQSAANKLNTVPFANLCTPGGVTFNVDQALLNARLGAGGVSFADVTVNVFDRCTNDPNLVVPIPSNGVYAYSGSNFVTGITNSRGTAVLESLEVGQTYTVEADNRRATGSPQTASVTVAFPAPQHEPGYATNVVNLYFPRKCGTVLTGGTGGTGGVTGGGL